jgi:dipeptidyl-peptidase-3
MRARNLLFIALVGFSAGLFCCKKEPADELQQELALPPVEEAEEGEKDEEVVESGNKEEPAPVKIERRESDFDAGRLSDVMLIRLYADDFPSLEKKSRILAYHLARAVLAGRDITYDQLHRDNLEVRHLVECIHRANVIPDPEVEAKLSDYLEHLWVHGGFYDSLTGKKFVPVFSFEQLEKAAGAARAMGADLDLRKGEPLEAKLSRLKSIIFDPNFQPVLASPVPLPGKDILKNSHLNIYDGVRMRDLSHFNELYPRNSRLISVGGKLVEEVYRLGEKRIKIPPGRYAQELRRVIRRLQDAMSSAKADQRKIFVGLVEHFRTGDPAGLRDIAENWLENSFDVEFDIGFTDTSIDPRETKGIYRGMVAFRDQPNTSKVGTLPRYVQHFEDALPWDLEYRRTWSRKPLALAAVLLVSAGRTGPFCNMGYRLDGGFKEDQAPSKIIVFSNVIEAYAQAVGKKVVYEFVQPAHRAAVLESIGEALLMQISFREVLGYDLGKTSRSARKQLTFAFPPVQAMKAELAALWLLADPKLTELGLLTGQKNSSAFWRYYIAESVVQQSFWADREPRHPLYLARRIIIRYLVEKANVVTFEEISGRVYPVISDTLGFKSAIARLLVRTERILANGDRRGALKLLNMYSAAPKWTHMERIAERAREINLRPIAVGVNPKLKPIKDHSGKVIDVKVLHKEKFYQQMMRYRIY